MARFRRYGQGSGPTIARIRRQNRRTSELVSTTDERDMGIRADAAKVFALDGAELEGPPEHHPSWCGVFGCRTCLGFQEVG
jgi:hypothetical protein